MSKNLKEEITDILEKSGLVDIHLAQGLIVQPIIETIINKIDTEEIGKVIKHYNLVGSKYSLHEHISYTLKKGIEE